MARAVTAILVAIVVGGGAIWFYQRARSAAPSAAVGPEVVGEDDAWVEHLYSQNPADAQAAAKWVEQMGAELLPDIRTILQDAVAERDHKKAALKACGILGQTAAPAIPDAAALVPDPALTTEAATALSFMGREAFAPLRESLASEDPVVRREALRAIGKLEDRAPLDTRAVVPLLLEHASDRDAGVRSVAATYLGIVRDSSKPPIPALVALLRDPDPAVRLAAATALESIGPDAAAAVPALRKATADRDPEVAREAARALIKLREK
jgi:HEAT repeat protein